MAVEVRDDHLSPRNNSVRRASIWSVGHRRARAGAGAGHAATREVPVLSARLQGEPGRRGGPRYLAVGHVTVDVLADGERRPGGTALYSALQAARLGLSATIVTRGSEQEIAAMLAPFEAELELIVQPGEATTTLATTGMGEERRQCLQSWAGPVALDRLPHGEILHLAPVADELAGRAQGEWPFVGLTPQGLARRWEEPGGEIAMQAPDAGLVAIGGRCDAIVLSEQERTLCAALLERAIAGGATVAVTAGPGSTEVLAAKGQTWELPAEPVADPVDDLGAGDVFAAAFFIRLAGGDEPLAAARIAHAAAALRMLGVGAGAIATAAEIESWAASPTQRPA
jgi:sugar/nucleoside kinase (ribokinase family)